MNDQEPSRTERLRTLAGVVLGMGVEDAEQLDEPIGDDRDMIQTIDFREYDDVGSIRFRFDSGEYRIDDSGDRPQFVEVGNDE